MQTVDLVVGIQTPASMRVRQVSSMFDCPLEEKQTRHWRVNMPLDERPWNIGLIVGPSGSGKTAIARYQWPEEIAASFKWDAPSVIDDFAPSHTIEEIANICQAVGFNTIPAWMRPFRVLSNGEQFRVSIARALLERSDPIVIDEFTSVVDRQVAKIASHAVQKYVRRNNRHLIACSCHFDIIEWLQPDWVFSPAEQTFAWRSLQRRPDIGVEIRRVPYETWSIFAPFHYMTAKLNRGAACFGLFADGRLATFSGVNHMPHPKVKNLKVVSRTVTLPDFQGIGLAFVLNETLGALYKAAGFRFRNYPAHPAFIRGHDRSPRWALCKRPGRFSSRSDTGIGRMCLQRPCAVFEYVGDPWWDTEEARRVLGGIRMVETRPVEDDGSVSADAASDAV